MRIDYRTTGLTTEHSPKETVSILRGYLEKSKFKRNSGYEDSKKQNKKEKEDVHYVAKFEFDGEESLVHFSSPREATKDMKAEEGTFLHIPHVWLNYSNTSRKPADLLWNFYTGFLAEFDAKAVFLRSERFPMLFRPKDLNNGPQGIAPITYLSDEMAAYVGTEKIETAPFYDIERVNNGYCLRADEMLPHGSNDRIESIEQHLGLEYHP